MRLKIWYLTVDFIFKIQFEFLTHFQYKVKITNKHNIVKH